MILDVGMSKKNGKEIYEEIRKIRTDIRALFIGGYTRSMILEKEVLGEETNFISKPLSSDELLLEVRAMLNQ